MKLTRSSILPVVGIALVFGLFAWGLIVTTDHHTDFSHMGYAIQQRHDQMQNGTMPMSGLRMDGTNMEAMHQAMLDNGASMPMQMTPALMPHPGWMGTGMGHMRMGAAYDGRADHMWHHPWGG